MSVKFVYFSEIRIHGYDFKGGIWSSVTLSVDEQYDVATLHGLPPQRRYFEMRLNGQSHKFAIMIASRQFPGIKTDAVFNEGKFAGALSDKVTAHELWLKHEAERRGVSTTGKWYCSGLARFPGDPTAWIDSMADVKRIARERNLRVDGYVTHEPEAEPPPPRIAIDPEIVHGETEDFCAENPGADYQEVYHRLEDLRSGKVVFKKEVPIGPNPDEYDE